MANVITYKSNNGKTKTIEGVTRKRWSDYAKCWYVYCENGKSYAIDKSGQYPLLKAFCEPSYRRGGYYRTIGTHPEIA